MPKQGDVVRLLYLHVPTIWIAFLGFSVTRAGFDSVADSAHPPAGVGTSLAGASAESRGVVFTGITFDRRITLGPAHVGARTGLWERGVLTTTAILFFLYLGYLGATAHGWQTVDEARASGARSRP